MCNIVLEGEMPIEVLLNCLVVVKVPKEKTDTKFKVNLLIYVNSE